MKLYLVDNEKLNTFDLPEKVTGSYLFSFKGNNNRENAINIDSSDNGWIVKSNGSVNIINNKAISPTVILKDYLELHLQLLGEKTGRLLYTLPTNDKNTVSYSAQGATAITIGKAPSCNINYNNPNVLPAHLNISQSGNDWYVVPAKEENALAYLNNKRIKMATKIYTGDIIFIFGMKIIWMKEFFVINNPNGNVKVAGLNPYIDNNVLDNTKYTPVSEDESAIELYTDNDYFSHTPRLRTVVEPKVVEIDSPPGNQDPDNDMPFLLSIATGITMAASACYMMYNAISQLTAGKIDKFRGYFMIMMAVLMLFGSLILPRITKRWQKNRKRERERYRQVKYSDYLSKKEKEISQENSRESQIITENNPPLKDVADLLKNNNRLVWSREIKEEDFLKVRLGIGTFPSEVDIKAPREGFTLDEDNLLNMASTVPEKYKMLNDVPVTFSLVENNICSFIFECGFKEDFLNGLLLQIFTYHSALDLKIVLFTNEENAQKWDYVKKLPHVWDEEHLVRYFSTSTEDSKVVLTELEKEFTRREETFRAKNVGDAIQEDRSVDKELPYTKYDTYYLIITDDYKIIKDSSFANKFFQENVNLGFSLMMISDSMRNLPQECNTFVQIYDKESGIFNKELTTQSLIKFKADYDPTINMEQLAILTSNIPIKSREAAAALPTSLSFLEMYNVGKIEQLNILNRWKTNNPTTSLSAPIGVHVSGDIFNLDLHEKKDGPHGLIAGSTGSGKSEFIITYVLSMAINYHPDEVQFVLIDYKGGGLAGAFENRETGVRIPHLAGTITNLDTAEMNRTLVSINSELKRRQAKFNEVRDSIGESTMDIYKYQTLYRDGTVKEPISHLFIISDEFAELKKQQPEFMSELISTARIGRSLGVHLILATQKPSGVVNDQIWSNSKFKICLKVQTAADSMEMLKRPDAASIKEAGRFYLKVGFDEFFDIGQSGWSGAQYIPSERIIKKIDDSINFINNTGNIIKTINDAVKQDETKEKRKDQVTSIVNYLFELSKKENIVTRKMWLDVIKEFITIDEVKNEYNYQAEPEKIEAIIGKYDYPLKQEQGIYLHNFNESGNLIINGIAGSGKENLITTMIYSICTNHTTDEVNIYIGDFGAETLTIFNKMPQVGDVFITSEVDKLQNFLKQINKEFDERKSLFADYGGNFKEYNEQSGNKKPLILIVLNSIESYIENYPRMGDAFNILFRDGHKYGINFIVSQSVSTIRGKTASYFPNVITLKQPTVQAYREIIGGPRGLIPADKYGRGLATLKGTVLEFQSAFICKREDINKTIREKGLELSEKIPDKAPKIKVLPEKCTIDDVIFEMKDVKTIPIGIEKNSLEVYAYNFILNRINIVSAINISNHIYFIYAIVKELLQNNTKVKIIDALNSFKLQYEGAQVYNDNFDKVLIEFAKELNLEGNQTSETAYILLGGATLKEKLSEQGKVVYEEIMKRANIFEHSFFILADNLDAINKIQIEDWYKCNVDTNCGIWLGEEVANQNVINVRTLTLDDKKISFPFIGYAIYKASHMIIKYVVDGMEDEKDE